MLQLVPDLQVVVSPPFGPSCPSTPLQFTRNAFGLSFLLLLLVSLAMTAFGFFVASFLHKAGASSMRALQHSWPPPGLVQAGGTGVP